MREATVYGTGVVILNGVTNLVHAVSHAEEHVMALRAWQLAYVILVIFIGPVVAAALLRTRFRRAGARLLLVSMAASLVLGLACHFLIPGADNVFSLQPGAWRALFRVSAALLLLLQGTGTVIGASVLVALSDQAAAGALLAGTRRASGAANR